MHVLVKPSPFNLFAKAKQKTIARITEKTTSSLDMSTWYRDLYRDTPHVLTSLVLVGASISIRLCVRVCVLSLQ